MANIVLLSKCNLKCKYCFADTYTSEKGEDITLENFKKMLDFSAPDGEVGLIGGEPLIYENIDTCLEILSYDMRFRRINIFTNGIFIDKHISNLCDRRFVILINVNSSKDIGKTSFEKIDNNINLLIDNGMRRNITLGINVYEQNQDFSDFLYLLKKYGFKSARISVAIPQNHTKGGIKYFFEMKNTLLSLYKELKNLGVCPCYDCNALPECVYSEEEKRFLETMPYVNDFEKSIFVGKASVCSPIIDLYPDFGATRCFGCYDMLKADIRDFKNITDLKNYFFKEIDTRLIHKKSWDKCENCYNFKVFKCYGGCLCYKRG